MAIESVNSLASPRPVDLRNQEQDPSGMGRDAFLKLLVAQLKNQDPLQPMDAKETVTQLSQLSSVEELRGIQARMQALEIASAGMANTQVAGLMGRNVTADAARLRLTETGDVTGSYELPGGASSLKATILNASGQAVRTIDLGEQTAGRHTLTWNGSDDTGARVTPGRYTVEYSAKDEASHPIEVSTRISGRVTRVSYEYGYPELMIGDTRVMLGDVVTISE